jgi:hypothetical protein
MSFETECCSMYSDMSMRICRVFGVCYDGLGWSGHDFGVVFDDGEFFSGENRNFYVIFRG